MHVTRRPHKFDVHWPGRGQDYLGAFSADSRSAPALTGKRPDLTGSPGNQDSRSGASHTQRLANPLTWFSQLDALCGDGLFVASRHLKQERRYRSTFAYAIGCELV